MKRTILSVFIGFSVAAHASPPLPEPARHLYEQGAAHFQAKEFDAAAEDFGAACAVLARPGLLHNWALALEKAGRDADAADVVARLAATAPGVVGNDARRWLKDLEKRLARTHTKVTLVGAPMAANVLVNDAPRARDWSGWAPAGRLVIVVSAEGYAPRTIETSATAGVPTTVDAGLAPKAYGAEAAVVVRSRRPPAPWTAQSTIIIEQSQPSTGVILLGSGGGLIGLGALLHLGVALPLAAALGDLDAGRADYDAEFDRRADVVEHVALSAWVSYGLGAALSLAGGIMMAVGNTSEDDAHEGEVHIGLGADGTLQVNGRF